MNQDSASTPIIHLDINWQEPSLFLQTDWFVLVGSIVMLLAFFLTRRKWFLNKFIIQDVELALGNLTFKVKRNTENLYIANRIYLELVTRKAALPFEEGKDVIKEVYDSWYKLFGIIREEIKNVPGEYLIDHDPTEALIGLTTEILNNGLRPHLTTYQAAFRKWYRFELEQPGNEGKTPQEIQVNFEHYDSLVEDLRKVNLILIEYAEQLQRLIRKK